MSGPATFDPPHVGTFVPKVSYTQQEYGIILRMNNGCHLGRYLSAELRHDTKCVKCGQPGMAGQRWVAHLAADPVDATWEHEYRATPQHPDGDTYRANFYDYAVIPVTLGAKPIDYAALAENAATWGAKKAGA